MPAVRPISDLQRNLSEISAECHETGKPIYLTKNGTASLVVMDARAYDECIEALEGIAEHEERVQRAIARGYDDMLNGRTRTWAAARRDADAIREARRAE